MADSISMVTVTREDIRILQVQGQEEEDLPALQTGHKSSFFMRIQPISCRSFLSFIQLCCFLFFVALVDTLFVLLIFINYCTIYALIW